MSFKYFHSTAGRPRDARRAVIVKNGYGPNWPKQRLKALKRDGYVCQACGHIGYKRPNGFWSVSAHHIRKIAWYVRSDGSVDYESANDLSNLITLCETNLCHASADGHRDLTGFNMLR